jgi:hypothetical protein
MLNVGMLALATNCLKEYINEILGPREALAFFDKIQFLGIKPNLITVVRVLAICAYLLALGQGMHIHGYAIRFGFESNEVGSWNAIIVGWDEVHLNMMFSWAFHLYTCTPNMGMLTLATSCLKSV